MKKKLKCAILGFGGMGHFHASQYPGQKDVELVALCDIDPKRFEDAEATINLGSSGKSDTSSLRKYLSYEEMMKAEKGNLDMIDICLPAYLHAEYSVRAMKDGLDVLVEKPMALSVKDCDRMIAAKRKTGRKLMVAQCIRFDAAYGLLASFIESGKYGKLQKLDMYRYGCYPLGSAGWYMDGNLSGGAIIDLHLHDIDWLQSVMGTPKQIVTFGNTGASGGYDEADNFFSFSRHGAIVRAMGSWMRAGDFKSGFTAIFEKAVLHKDGEIPRLTDINCKEMKLSFKPPKTNMYYNEIAYFAKCARNGLEPERCLPSSTRETVRIIELERLSASKGGEPVKGRK